MYDLWCLRITCFWMSFFVIVIGMSAQRPERRLRFNPYLQSSAPVLLISTGSLRSATAFHKMDLKLRQSVISLAAQPTHADDYLQHVPLAGLLLLNGLNFAKPVHSIQRQILLGGSSLLLTVIAAQSVKVLTKIERPDYSNKHSFPSGHPDWAFAGDELVWQEFGYRQKWIGIAAYSVAGMTGLLRIYNNRHWTTDVLAGAGIGMLSVKLNYFIEHYISQKKSKNEIHSSNII